MICNYKLKHRQYMKDATKGHNNYKLKKLQT